MGNSEIQNVDSGVEWNSSRWGRYLSIRSAVPSTVAVKLVGLLSVVKPLNKLFSVTIACFCFSISFCCFFPLLLLTITLKNDIFNITFLYDSESFLHPQHILEVCQSVIETRWNNAIEISEKCWKRPLTKNVDTKTVRHFEENNYQGDDLHANHNKND